MISMTKASSFILTFSSTSSSSSSPSSIFSKSQIYPPSSSSSSPSLSRFACRSQLNSREDLPFILHDTLQTSGIDITHAKEAREGFVSQIKRLTKIERQISIAIHASADLAKTALFIAAEDDALVSHSSVPLPVKSFIERLDDLSMGFVTFYSLNLKSASPEVFLDGLESYLYGYKGFRRAPASDLPESKALYLNSVLTHRSGSAVMLSLIYSEILKMLRMWGLLNCDVEISCPHDQVNLPKGYHKQKSRDSDQRFILTQQSLLVEILRSLKEVFWPFRYDPSRSLFLRAAWAAKCISGPTTVETAFERASTKAAQHRLERGVWTSVRLGDMRRALAASERLILLDHDVDELRDYSILLYHCGFYEESWHYLNLYMNSTISPKSNRFTSKLEQMEGEAVEELKTRLKLILMEDNLTKPSNFRNFLGSQSEPW